MLRTALALVLLAAGLVGAGIVAALQIRAMMPENGANTVREQSVQIRQHSPETMQHFPETIVSLTFLDGWEGQWRYAVPLLRSHHMDAAFYVITADSDRPHPCCMSWAQLRTLQGEGDDIGSYTVDHPNLTALTTARVRQEVCGSRQDMLRNGIDDPESFAYPFGSYDRAREKIVAQCGFTNARRSGGISWSKATPGGPWAETLPPQNPEAVRTIAADAARPIRLPDLENYVSGAATHGGGWLAITFHDVCAARAADYVQCMSSYGPIQDTVLRRFLDWLRDAGRSHGAPAGVVVRTMRWAMNTANGPDTTAPVTTVRCNGSPCRAAYSVPVNLSLSAADPGGVGVAKTYWTADGSTPSTSSGVYQTPLRIGETQTIKFFSVDNAGNREKVKTITVRVG